MESLQYLKEFLKDLKQLSFKPYYKWNTFNTTKWDTNKLVNSSFKPYYNWNTFNTKVVEEMAKNQYILF